MQAMHHNVQPPLDLCNTVDESGRTSCSKYGSGESNDGWLEQQEMLGDAGGIGEGHIVTGS